MKVTGLTKTKLRFDIPPPGITYGNTLEKKGQTILLENPSFKQDELPMSEFHAYKFVKLIFGGGIVTFRILPRVHGIRPIESISGPRCVLEHNGWPEEITFSSFLDCEKNRDKSSDSKNSRFLLPELSPLPDENDTRIVLHHQLLKGDYAYGRLYRYFSLEDKEILLEKYVILELPHGERRIAIIKGINKETKSVIFDIVRAGVIGEFENETEKYGVFAGAVLDDVFTAYEYFMDVAADYFYEK